VDEKVKQEQKLYKAESKFAEELSASYPISGETSGVLVRRLRLCIEASFASAVDPSCMVIKPINDPKRSKGLDTALLEKLTLGLADAKDKHPKPSFEALLSEVGELADEIIRVKEDSIPFDQQERIEEEALDVAVIAIRLATEEVFP